MKSGTKRVAAFVAWVVIVILGVFLVRWLFC